MVLKVMRIKCNLIVKTFTIAYARNSIIRFVFNKVIFLFLIALRRNVWIMNY